MSGSSEEAIIADMRAVIATMNAYAVDVWTEQHVVEYFETVVTFAEANPKWQISAKVIGIKDRWIEHQLLG